MNERQRFIAIMEYFESDRIPNWELGVWAQTRKRWEEESSDVLNFKWDWFSGEDQLKLDRRKFISVNYGLIPHFEKKILEENERYIVYTDNNGITRRTLKEGRVNNGAMCMDEYISFPVKKSSDFEEIKKRMVVLSERYNEFENEIESLKHISCPLILGKNTQAGGFFWRAREWLGTEQLCYAWYDWPDLMHEMMNFYADFTIEVSKYVLKRVNRIDYFNLSEDFAMKTGPLISPDVFKNFIFKPMKRLIEFMKSMGVRYVTLDSDGDFTPLIPLLIEAGIDAIWPIERASTISSPLELRRKFGKSLRLWGGVDKRVLCMNSNAIKEHLKEFIPLIEEGGFIPTVDHLVPPDVPYDNFKYYMEYKWYLINRDFSKFE